MSSSNPGSAGPGGRSRKSKQEKRQAQPQPPGSAQGGPKRKKAKKRRKRKAPVDSRFSHAEVDPRFLPIDARTQATDSRLGSLLEPSFQMLGKRRTAPKGRTRESQRQKLKDAEEDADVEERALKGGEVLGLGSLYRFTHGGRSGESGGGEGAERRRAAEIRRELIRQEREDLESDGEEVGDAAAGLGKGVDEESDDDVDVELDEVQLDDDGMPLSSFLNFRERLFVEEQRQKERKKAKEIPAWKELVEEEDKFVSPWDVLESSGQHAESDRKNDDDAEETEVRVRFDPADGVFRFGDSPPDSEDEGEGAADSASAPTPAAAAGVTIDGTTEEGVPLAEISTARVAVMNHDFDLVNLKDLYAIFSSFCPRGGSVLRITKYFSREGERMISEDLAGAPPQVYRDKEAVEAEKRDRVQREMERAREKGVRHLRKRTIDLKERDRLDSRRVVLFELQKLRHFFALVEFDSPGAAGAVYDACDGMDVEDSQQYLDLRMVPQSKSFEDYMIAEGPLEALDLAQYVPDIAGRGRSRLFQPPVDFNWDRPSAARKRALSGADGVPEEEILKFLNVEVDPEDEETEEDRARFRQILLSKNDDEEEDDDDEDKDKSVDLEGLDAVVPIPIPDAPVPIPEGEIGEGVVIPLRDTDSTERAKQELLSLLRDQQLAKTETFHERRKRRRREKKKKRQRDLRQRREEDRELAAKGLVGAAAPDDAEETERLKRLLHQGTEEEDKAEFDIGADRQREQQRLAHEKASGRETGFELEGLDEDERFGQLVDDPDFNLDPTHTKYKKTKNVEKIILRKRKRKRDQMEHPESVSDSHFFATHQAQKKNKKKRKDLREPKRRKKGD